MPTKPKPLVLIVEDEAELANVISEHLEAAGMQTQICNRCSLAMRFLKNNFANIILLDLTLPDQNGFAFMEDLKREDINIPTIFLTGNDSEISKVKGLELGADDYVTKPFSFMELAARAEALLRRTSGQLEALHRGDLASEATQFGDVTIDFDRHEANKAGHPLSLTPREFRLLDFFVRHRGEVVTRDQLLDAVWGYNTIPFTRTVDTHIAKLRKKVEDSPADPKFIITVHRLGYKFKG